MVLILCESVILHYRSMVLNININKNNKIPCDFVFKIDAIFELLQ